MYHFLTCNRLSKVLADSLSLSILWSEIIGTLSLIPSCIHTSIILHNFDEAKRSQHNENARKHNVSSSDYIRKTYWGYFGDTRMILHTTLLHFKFFQKKNKKNMCMNKPLRVAVI